MGLIFLYAAESLNMSTRCVTPTSFHGTAGTTTRLLRVVVMIFAGTHAVLSAAAAPQPIAADHKPAMDSPLVERLRGCKIKGISPSWATLPCVVDKDGAVPKHTWSGETAYGTPVQLDDNTIAVVQKERGQKFAVWHLDMATETVVFKVDVDAAVSPAAKGPFDSVSWHRINNDLVGEFISFDIKPWTTFVGQDRSPKTMYDGQALITLVNLRTGDIRRVREGNKRTGTKERCQENLTKQRLGDNSRVELAPPDSVTKHMQQVLAAKKQVFDFRQGRFLLTLEVIDELANAAQAVVIDGPDSLQAIRKTQQIIRNLPTCAAVRDLSWQCSLAEAVVTENVDSLEAMVADRRNPKGASDDRRSQMRNLAAYQWLHLIASNGDQLSEYEAFARSCDDGIAARDAAILRIHELRFISACNEATVAAFDDFVAWAPHAIQAKDAIRHAYDLQQGQIQISLASNEDPEAIARNLYNDWRNAVRQGSAIKAQRSFTLLTEEPAMKKTQTSVQAQDTKDEDGFRAIMLAHARKNDELLSSVIAIQQQQLSMMNAQLLEQSEMNVRLGRLGSQLQHIEYSGQRSAEGIEAIRRQKK